MKNYKSFNSLCAKSFPQNLLKAFLKIQNLVLSCHVFRAQAKLCSGLYSHKCRIRREMSVFKSLYKPFFYFNTFYVSLFYGNLLLFDSHTIRTFSKCNNIYCKKYQSYCIIILYDNICNIQYIEVIMTAKIFKI